MVEAETTNPWAETVAEQVRYALDGMPKQEWLDPRDFAAVYRYSADQAGHILRRAHEYGALERTKEGRRFVYRPAKAADDDPEDSDEFFGPTPIRGTPWPT